MGQVTCALRLHESSVKQILDIGLLKGLFFTGTITKSLNWTSQAQCVADSFGPSGHQCVGRCSLSRAAERCGATW